ncbi:MAG TPA: DUF370 domain-containing protein [Clostridiales bacterium]|nr:DUF370 domain-containing protein [Clostridiales bacterium]
MYLHLGQDVLVAYKDIIGIFDLDTTTVSKTSRDFLRDAEKAGRVVYVGTELPKSFVLCSQEKNDSKVYIAQLSSSTLLKRAESLIK